MGTSGRKLSCINDAGKPSMKRMKTIDQQAKLQMTQTYGAGVKVKTSYCSCVPRQNLAVNFIARV